MEEENKSAMALKLVSLMKRLNTIDENVNFTIEGKKGGGMSYMGLWTIKKLEKEFPTSPDKS